jgi:hypothetical protein
MSKPPPHVFKFRLTAPFDQLPTLEMKLSADGKTVMDQSKTVASISEGLLEISRMSQVMVDRFNNFTGNAGSVSGNN